MKDRFLVILLVWLIFGPSVLVTVLTDNVRVQIAVHVIVALAMFAAVGVNDEQRND